MKESEAIKEFQQNIDMPFGSNISREASKLAIQALEKQIAKKAKVKKYSFNYEYSKITDKVVAWRKLPKPYEQRKEII